MTDPTRTDTAFVPETAEEPRMPGHETQLDDKPQAQGSDKGKDTAAQCRLFTHFPDPGTFNQRDITIANA